MAGIEPAKLGEDAPDLAAVLTTFEDLLQTEKLADRATIMRIAAEERAQRRSQLPLLLLDVLVWTALEAQLIESLAASSLDTLATVPSGDQRTLERLRSHLVGAETTEAAETAAGALGRLQASLFSEGTATPAERGDDVVFMSAAGESRECVEIARRIIREAQTGTPFDRMAILLRSPTQYRAHLQEVLRRARIPVNFASGAIQPDPAGRAFLALLSCLDEGLLGTPVRRVPLPRRDARRHTAERASPSRTGKRSVGAARRGALAGRTGRRDLGRGRGRARRLHRWAVVAGTLRTPRRWEQILVDSAVIGGRSRWERRLSGWREELAIRLAELEADDPRDEGTGRDPRSARGPPFVCAADPGRSPVPAPRRRPGANGWTGSRRLRPARSGAPTGCCRCWPSWHPWPPSAGVALARCGSYFARRLANLVLVLSSRSAGRLFVGPVAAARGLAFDVVFVPGLAERMFPQRVNQDPLLRDEIRIGLGKDLDTVVDRIEAERLALRIAVGSANRRVVLSYPRVDAEQARPRVPSFYGLEVLRAVEGRLPSFEVLAARCGTRQRLLASAGLPPRIPPTPSTRRSTTFRCSTSWSSRPQPSPEPHATSSPPTSTWPAPYVTER